MEGLTSTHTGTTVSRILRGLPSGPGNFGFLGNIVDDGGGELTHLGEGCSDLDCFPSVEGTESDLLLVELVLQEQVSDLVPALFTESHDSVSPFEFLIRINYNMFNVCKSRENDAEKLF
ncbi:MAG: hypothetical protein AAB644_01255 [Patescibacteria group bacterium]